MPLFANRFAPPLLAGLGLLAPVMPVRAADRIPIKVIIVTGFEVGDDTGDAPGEFQFWKERRHLDTRIAFPQSHHDVFYNPKTGVLGMVTGMGSITSATATLALGLDPRFDLSHAYWLVAGIAGIDLVGRPGGRIGDHALELRRRNHDRADTAAEQQAGREQRARHQPIPKSPRANGKSNLALQASDHARIQRTRPGVSSRLSLRHLPGRAPRPVIQLASRGYRPFHPPRVAASAPHPWRTSGT